MTKQLVSMTVNGREREGYAEARKTLADFLREDLQLTGTHLGCEHGACGACTVLLDGEAVRSCLMFAVQAEGSEIMTIEGLALDGELHPLQAAMRDSHGFQCGFCTPGFLMTAYALLLEQTDRTEEEWREELAGNLCRCTGYQSIIDGVQLAARRLAGEGVAR
jgi:carbon-monoxide dehydrogenase small subunit